MAVYQQVIFVVISLLPFLTRGQYFANQPTDAQVIQGDELVLRCTIASNYEARVFWRVPSTSSLIGPDYSVPPSVVDQFEVIGEKTVREYNLRIRQVQPSHQGEYECVLIWDADNLEVASQRARIDVISIASDGTPGCMSKNGRVLTEGDIGILLCLSQNAALDLRWQRSGLDLSRSEISSEFAPNAIESTVTAHPLDHEQEYTCVASGSDLPACSVTLSVRYKPSVTLESSGSSSSGNDGRFDCMADGNPNAFAYTWYYNQYEVQYIEHPRFNRVRLENNGATLVIPDLTSDDNGAYIRCEVLNEVGTGMSNFNVTVTASKSLAQVVGPILLAVILGVVFLLMFLYYCWWKHQQGRLKRIIKKRFSVPRTKKTIPTITNGILTGPAIRMNNSHMNTNVVPRSGLDLEGVGYGPDTVSLGYSRDEDAFGPVDYNDDDDDDAIRPIPRKKSISSSIGVRPTTESESDNDYAAVDLEADEEEVNKVFTYHVNPNFATGKSKKDSPSKIKKLNSYNVDDEDNENDYYTAGPDPGPDGEMLSTEL